MDERREEREELDALDREATDEIREQEAERAWWSIPYVYIRDRVDSFWYGA